MLDHEQEIRERLAPTSQHMRERALSAADVLAEVL